MEYFNATVYAGMLLNTCVVLKRHYFFDKLCRDKNDEQWNFLSAL